MAAKKRTLVMTPAVQKDYGKGLKAMRKHVRSAKSHDEAKIRTDEIVNQVVRELKRVLDNWKIKGIAIIFCILSASTSARAQGEWELGVYHQHSFRNAGGTLKQARVIEYLQGFAAQTNKSGFWVFVSADTAHGPSGIGYFDVALGEYHTFSLIPLELGLGGGYEAIDQGQNQSSYFGRWAGYGKLGGSRNYASFYIEGGPSAKHWATRFDQAWYQAEASILRGRVLTGLFSQTDLGHGARVRYTGNLHRGLDLRAWVAPMAYKEEGSWKKHLVIGMELVASGTDKGEQ